MEELGERHATVAVLVFAPMTNGMVTLTDRHLKSRSDVVHGTSAWDVTHEGLGSHDVLPCRTRKVDLIRGITRSEFLCGADGCLRGVSRTKQGGGLRRLTEHLLGYDPDLVRERRCFFHRVWEEEHVRRTMDEKVDR